MVALYIPLEGLYPRRFVVLHRSALRSLRRISPLAVLLWAGLAAPLSAQPAYRVVDLNTTAPPQPLYTLPYPDQPFKAYGGVVFFVVDDGIHGLELWRTDGTAAGTRILKDICPGACHGRPSQLTLSNGMLFFRVNDGAHGDELWTTDGTAAGTRLVADVTPGLSGYVQSMMDAGDALYFVTDDGVHGNELWRTDGTTAGTYLVKDIEPGSGGGVQLLAFAGGRLLFGGWDHLHGLEPWLSDGTEAGTVMLGDLNPGFASSLSFSFYPIGDAAPAPQGGFLFSASDGASNAGVWYTDGTPEGTVFLTGAGSPQGMTAFNGAIYFVASDADSGVELWKSDGTAAGTGVFRDLRPGADSSEPQELTVAGSRLFFRANDGVHGAELWKSDGTMAGTVLVTDLYPGSIGTFADTITSPPSFNGFSALGSDLMFLAYSAAGLRVWRSDGTAAGTVAVTPGIINHLLANSVAVAGGRFYFRKDYPGLEIWKSDGTQAGTTAIKDLATAPSAFNILGGFMEQPGVFGALENLLFFQASNGVSRPEPWRSDGTPEGTWKVATLGGPFGSYPHLITPLDDKVVFMAYFTSSSIVWASDGTSAGTEPLAPSNLFPSTKLVASGGSAFFHTEGNSFNSARLWTTDGTPEGTLEIAQLSTGFIVQILPFNGKVLVSDSGGLWVSDGTAPGTLFIRDNSGVALTRFLNQAGGEMFFVDEPRSASGTELWKTDGTEAGTVLVQNGAGFLPHLGGAAPAGGPLLFARNSGGAGAELWRTDGTSAGTVLVKDIFPDGRGSEPFGFITVNDKVFFVADDGVHGRELWVSDGTAAGTRMVVDLLPGPGSSVPHNLTVVDQALLFAATDGVHGVEPWRTDGSVIGTRMIRDIAPGALSSSPLEFTAAGPNVYFAANDNTTGFELWAVPKSNVLAIFEDVPTTYFARRFVEALVAQGVTGGCGPGQFCPSGLINRAQAAVFLLAARDGVPPPPATGNLFQDVPANYWAGRWIERLATEGVTSGCSAAPPLYCPDGTLTRAQMAVLLLGARQDTPPPATGTLFTDVPADYWAARWIEHLATQGITGGCGGGKFCPDQPITRGEMAVFLVAAFGLPLP
jgi:ELWxxDGT repeat protein